MKIKKILQDEKATVNTFINYCIGVTHSLELKKKKVGLENTRSKTVRNFKNSDSIKKIKKSQQASENSSFSFKVITEEEVKNAMKNLPIMKSTISGDIPTKILRQHTQI